MPKPTIHLTNWSSRKLHGPGRKFTIMARPRQWEHGEGFVYELTPPIGLLIKAQQGQINMETYRKDFMFRARRLSTMGKDILQEFQPGRLVALKSGLGIVAKLKDGDTLCCACSRAKAAAGECHRVWAAELLVEAGWRVLLDGKEVSR